ncbi:hypothetical protein [Paenibacillus flagellatus]|uniref:Uncharacterized protein n=1 Tax=Paenibacillus flagellatus TaxID=2211139 RepID=A0A2V5KAF9_9BACL|nr:hypothetical protein [Paenibacillus flagellatus]PYI55892.1 hypothetical protein DLM86_09275 [Paenibacillus flagellatus]
MQLKNQDLAVIKQALKVAMDNERNEQASYSYREVLAKLAYADEKERDEAPLLNRDGFRYDYDDASDV